MKTLVRTFLAAAIVLFVVQCQDQNSPVAVDESSWNALVLAATPEQIAQAQEIDQMIRDLFKASDENTAVNKFCSAANDFVRGKIAPAHKKLFELINFTLTKYRQGRLENGPGGGDCRQSAACRQKLADLFNELFDFFGIEHDSVPPEAFAEDAAAATCGPAGCTIVTDTQFAGVRIPPGALSSTVFIFIHRLPDSPGPLNTDLDQYPLFYFYGSDPEVTFSTDIDLAQCVLDDPPFEIGAPEGTELRLAHNFSDGIEILPLGPSDFIDCTDAAPMAFHTPPWQGFLADALRPFSPSLLYAMPGELGSKASNFSPFGAVDIESGEIATETTLVADPDTVFVGDPFTLTASVTPDPVPSEDPQVEFFDISSSEVPISLGTAPVNVDGNAVLVVDTSFECGSGPCVGPGAYTFVAEFLGTPSHTSSTSNEEDVLVDFSE